MFSSMMHSNKDLMRSSDIILYFDTRVITKLQNAIQMFVRP